MESVVVTVEGPGGRSADLELPVSVPLDVLLPLVAEGLGWVPPAGDDSSERVYQLLHQYSRAAIDPQETLDSAGVVTGDILYLRVLLPDFPAARGPVLVAQSGEIFRLGAETVIGRPNPRKNVTVDLDLSPLDVGQHSSRPHARIVREGDRFAVYDMDSRNGTFLNGQQITPGKYYVLKHGDELKFGAKGVTLQFQHRTR